MLKACRPTGAIRYLQQVLPLHGDGACRAAEDKDRGDGKEVYWPHNVPYGFTE